MGSRGNATLKRVKALFKLFRDGEIPTLPQHEVHPRLRRSSRENYLYFTLPPCINFQRSSPAMWRSALATWNDAKTRHLFFPEKVAKCRRAKIQRDLAKHGLALQRNKHTDIWIKIANTLHSFYNDDPRELLRAGGFDVTGVLGLIQGDKSERFTHLRGPKMANYWLYILSRYTDGKLKDMQEISIIPDTHVIQSSARLGVADASAGPVAVAERWRVLLKGSGIAPVEMHPVLWNWSRNGFTPEV